jgi:hypothetical protein
MRTRKQARKVPEKLTEVEQDLLSQMQHGYQLETDSRRSGLLLRRVKDHAVMRPAAANRTTVKALEERGLISVTKSRDPLTIIWRVNKNKTA